MGTNYYLRLKEPRMVAHRDIIHIAKCSCGWKPLFQAVTPGNTWNREYAAPRVEQDDDEGVTVYAIHSVNDIRAYLRTGKFEVIDEYGDVLTPEQFEEEVVNWGTPDAQPHTGTCTIFKDPEGYEFEKNDFR